jgi:hypothetical protein
MTPLSRILDSASLRYQLREDGSAAFRLHASAGAPVSFSAKIRGNVCQFVAHEIPIRNADPILVNAWNLAWAWGRFWTEGDQTHASTALYLSPGGVRGYEVFQTVEGLRLAVEAVEQGTFPEFVEQLTGHWPIPATFDAAAALGQTGLPFRSRGDGWQVSIESAPGLLVDVDVVASSAFLCFRGSIPGAPDWDRLRRLNRALPAGALAAADDRIYFLLDMPLAWTPVDGLMCKWALDSLTSALEAYVGPGGCK